MELQINRIAFLCFQKNKESMGDIVANSKLRNGKSGHCYHVSFTVTYKIWRIWSYQSGCHREFCFLPRFLIAISSSMQYHVFSGASFTFGRFLSVCFLAYFSTLKQEAMLFSETSVGIQLHTRRYIPEDRTL
jgi:hypothetical protein